MDPVGYADDPERDRSQPLRSQVTAVLDWVYGGPEMGALDPVAGLYRQAADLPENVTDEKGNVTTYRRCWRPLGLKHTPVVVLSSLAPGVDTLVAETVLDYAAAHPELDLTVRAPLPFPSAPPDAPPEEDIYRRASTFNTAEKVARYEALKARLFAQAGWDASRDFFEVTLDKDLAGDAESDLTREVDGKQRRHLRYRAAGEYVAAYSDLLLALYDETLDQANPNHLHESGAATIVEVKQTGLSWELLAVSNNFAWTDNGPVLHLPITRKKNNHPPAADAPPRPWRFLHPLDCRPETKQDENKKKEIPHDYPQWQSHGDAIFRGILEHEEAFNEAAEVDETLMKKVRADENREWYRMMLPRRQLQERFSGREVDEAVLDDHVKQKLGSENNPDSAEKAFRFARQLADAAAVRRRAGNLSGELEGKRRTMLLTMFVLIGFAATFLSAFEHWHPQGHGEAAGSHVSEPLPVSEAPGSVDICFRGGLLLGALLSIAAAARQYQKFLRSRSETRRHDSRALAEALRVQFYWSLAGTHHSVAANYMQRQRTELGWIRCAVSSLTFPYHRWREGAEALPLRARCALLEIVRERWITSQKDYFSNKVKTLKNDLRFWHTMGWAFGVGAVIQITGMMAQEFFPDSPLVSPLMVRILALALFLSSLTRVLAWFRFSFDHLWKQSFVTLCNRWFRSPDRPPQGTLESSGSFLKRFKDFEDVLPGVKLNPEEHAEPAEEENAQRSWFSWLIASRRDIWLLGCFIGSMVLVLPQYLPEVTAAFPDKDDWWIILTGVTLLAGGFCLGWSERNFHSELLRQYLSMTELFQCADTRLEKLLERLKACPSQDPPSGQFPPNSDTGRVLHEVVDLLYNLGCEALDENAEWLILHRAKPLEPMLAG